MPVPPSLFECNCAHWVVMFWTRTQLVVHFHQGICGIEQHPRCMKMHLQLIVEAAADHNVPALVQKKVASLRF